MKYLDYAAMGAASSAYAEASRAQAGVNQLWNEMQLLRNDINNEKYERNYQKWIEELIYQLSKTVNAISESPAEPLNDYIDLKSFILIIEDNNLNTSVISGLENKRSFETTLLQAQQLLDKLRANPQVQEYFCQQETARREKEQLRAARVANAAIEVQSRRFAVKIALGLCVVMFMCAVGVESGLLGVASIAGAILCAYLLW